ncbi:MAG TPA: pyridoxal phosphate-dependent aminotransferase [Thermoanaerobaculia bacterium]|nr:pyridoxal phosphate-dependent aminotransferase [Thermoanaerobaculia bacterium]HUM30451.1 pyridoxal phosphate-dependent aminotransferase [Thermoanaerobaculia bacterium]HXK68682.1 pyridoxal phosphate-dependent aminotransferase [Thermoanaerobaculia bacterium]
MEHIIRRKLPRSLTLSIAGKVQELTQSGQRIFKFNIGEPDFPTPRDIKDEGIRAIEENFTRYTAGAGIPELRAAIADDLRRRLDLSYTSKEIVVTVGGKFALAAAIMATVGPGDEVLIPVPSFLSYPDMVTIAGGIPVRVPLGPETSFFPTPQLLDTYVSQRTRLVILNSPHNPTGVVYPEELVASLAEWASKRNIYILSDEVYDQLIFDEIRHHSIAAFPHIRDRVLIVNSFSKTYCMTGWRLGYLAAPEPLAEAVTHIQSHMASSPNSIAQRAALRALQAGRPEGEQMLISFQLRRDLMCDLLSSVPGVKFIRPSGTFYLFLDVSSYFGERISGSMDMAMYLLDKYHVATVPGLVFGDDRFIRLSFATSDEEIREGIQALSDGLSSLCNGRD